MQEVTISNLIKIIKDKKQVWNKLLNIYCLVQTCQTKKTSIALSYLDFAFCNASKYLFALVLAVAVNEHVYSFFFTSVSAQNNHMVSVASNEPKVTHISSVAVLYVS